MEPEKRRGGRPKSESEFPHKVFSYLDDEGLAQLEALTQKRKLSRAALVRTLIQEAHQREGLADGAE